MNQEIILHSPFVEDCYYATFVLRGDEQLQEKKFKNWSKPRNGGFLRETDDFALRAGIDKDIGLFRTVLPTYSKENFSRDS